MKQTTLKFKPQLVEEPKPVEDRLLLCCVSWRDAVKVGIRLSPFTQTEIAEAMHISESHFSEILNKKSELPKYFDLDRLPELEAYIGNTCVSQFIDLQRRGLLHSQNRREMTVEEKAEAYDREHMRKTA